MALRQPVERMSVDTQAKAEGVLNWFQHYCDTHGYSLTIDAQDRGHLTVSIGPDSFTLVLTEELAKVDLVPNERIDAARYDWQRVRKEATEQATGKLHLQLNDYGQPTSWADRTRWDLMSRLPIVMQQLEMRAHAKQEGRDRRQRDYIRDLQVWNEAVSAAGASCQEARMLARATNQVQEWSRASELRHYADALRRLPDERLRTSAHEWANWIDKAADAVDPLSDSNIELTVNPPEQEMSTEELDKYMPKHMSSARPPADPGR